MTTSSTMFSLTFTETKWQLVAPTKKSKYGIRLSTIKVKISKAVITNGSVNKYWLVRKVILEQSGKSLGLILSSERMGSWRHVDTINK